MKERGEFKDIDEIDEYHITLDSRDVSPKNFMTVDSIVAMVQRKLEEKK